MAMLRHAALFYTMLLLFTVLVGYGAWVHSPTFDEPAHLAAGWSHWELGRFDAYRVNPPLVRLVAALPLRISGQSADLGRYNHRVASRSEFSLGKRLLEHPRGFAFVTQARWACIPFGLIGACVCFAWARQLYGVWSGLLAAALWCFSPTVLGHGQLITPDVAAAALGCAAGYCFWRWLRDPSWQQAVGAGLALGLAALTKSTLLFLFPLWPLLWLACRDHEAAAWTRQASRLCAILALALLVVNAGYGFEGSFTPLKEFQFVSRALGGDEQFSDVQSTGNRFAGQWWSAAFVPLPRNYLLGMDVQRREFEEQKYSYLRGEWRLGGWWYYYLYALLVKEPLGLWGLAALAVFARPAVLGRDELVLFAPMLLVFGLVSSQTGFNHHFRYVLPALPFLFILVSRVAADLKPGAIASRWQTQRMWLAAALLAGYVASSLMAYPHSLSYFNEIVGGSRGGPKHLLGSSTDWGQDLFFLRWWLDKHPEVTDYRLAWTASLIDPRHVGIDASPPPTLVQCCAVLVGKTEAEQRSRRWCFLSVNELYQNGERYSHFRNLQPAAIIGDTIYAYHVSWLDLCPAGGEPKPAAGDGVALELGGPP